MNPFLKDPRFAGIEPFEKKVWLASPTMHGDEQRWVDEAIQTNWVSTVGASQPGYPAGPSGVLLRHDLRRLHQPRGL